MASGSSSFSPRRNAGNGDTGVTMAANRVLRERMPPSALGAPLDQAFPEAPSATIRRLRKLIDQTRESSRVQSLFGERLALFGDAGWAGVRGEFAKQAPLLAWGVGASFLDGLVRLDISRGVRWPAGWRVDLYWDGAL